MRRLMKLGGVDVNQRFDAWFLDSTVTESTAWRERAFKDLLHSQQNFAAQRRRPPGKHVGDYDDSICSRLQTSIDREAGSTSQYS